VFDFISKGYAVKLDLEVLALGSGGSSCECIAGAVGPLLSTLGSKHTGDMSSQWTSRVQARTQPVLHLLLGHVLARYGKETALRSAAMCEGSPILSYSAELLLYLSLDHETSKKTIKGMEVPAVLSFLRGTDVFHEALVGVARKVRLGTPRRHNLASCTILHHAQS